MSEQIDLKNSNNPALPPIDFSTPMGKWSFLIDEMTIIQLHATHHSDQLYWG
jgi:hypothetical protein